MPDFMMHIEEVFAKKEPGEFLTVAQIRDALTSEYPDESKRPSDSAIIAAMFQGNREIPGVHPTIRDGRKGGERTGGELTYTFYDLPDQLRWVADATLAMKPQAKMFEGELYLAYTIPNQINEWLEVEYRGGYFILNVRAYHVNDPNEVKLEADIGTVPLAEYAVALVTTVMGSFRTPDYWIRPGSGGGRPVPIWVPEDDHALVTIERGARSHKYMFGLDCEKELVTVGHWPDGEVWTPLAAATDAVEMED